MTYFLNKHITRNHPLITTILGLYWENIPKEAEIILVANIANHYTGCFISFDPTRFNMSYSEYFDSYISNMLNSKYYSLEIWDKPGPGFVTIRFVFPLEMFNTICNEILNIPN